MKKYLALLLILIPGTAFSQISLSEIKGWYETGDKPTQLQFSQAWEYSYNTVSDGLFDLSGGNAISLSPHTSALPGVFYRLSTAPTNNSYLKYNGNFHATKLFIGNTDIETMLGGSSYFSENPELSSDFIKSDFSGGLSIGGLDDFGYKLRVYGNTRIGNMIFDVTNGDFEIPRDGRLVLSPVDNGQTGSIYYDESSNDLYFQGGVGQGYTLEQLAAGSASSVFTEFNSFNYYTNNKIGIGGINSFPFPGIGLYVTDAILTDSYIRANTGYFEKLFVDNVSIDMDASGNMIFTDNTNTNIKLSTLLTSDGYFTDYIPGYIRTTEKALIGPTSPTTTFSGFSDAELITDDALFDNVYSGSMTTYRLYLRSGAARGNIIMSPNGDMTLTDATGSYILSDFTGGDSPYFYDSGSNVILNSGKRLIAGAASLPSGIGYPDIYGPSIATESLGLFGLLYFDNKEIEKVAIDGNGIATGGPNYMATSQGVREYIFDHFSLDGDTLATNNILRLGGTSDEKLSTTGSIHINSETGRIFFGDKDTYIHQIADDTLVFSVGGAEALRLDSSGFVLSGQTFTGNTTTDTISTNVFQIGDSTFLASDFLFGGGGGTSTVDFTGFPNNSIVLTQADTASYTEDFTYDPVAKYLNIADAGLVVTTSGSDINMNYVAQSFGGSGGGRLFSGLGADTATVSIMNYRNSGMGYRYDNIPDKYYVPLISEGVVSAVITDTSFTIPNKLTIGTTSYTEADFANFGSGGGSGLTEIDSSTIFDTLVEDLSPTYAATYDPINKRLKYIPYNDVSTSFDTDTVIANSIFQIGSTQYNEADFAGFGTGGSGTTVDLTSATNGAILHELNDTIGYSSAFGIDGDSMKIGGWRFTDEGLSYGTTIGNGRAGILNEASTYSNPVFVIGNKGTGIGGVNNDISIIAGNGEVARFSTLKANFNRWIETPYINAEDSIGIGGTYYDATDFANFGSGGGGITSIDGTTTFENLPVETNPNYAVVFDSVSKKIKVSPIVDASGKLESDTVLTNITQTNKVEFTKDSSAITGAHTIDLSGNSVINRTLTGNVTLDYSGATTGTYIIVLTQDATGGRTVSWTASKWQASGGSVTIDTTANGRTVLSCFYDTSVNKMVITEIQNLSDL